MARGAEVRVAIVADNSDLNRTLGQSESKLKSFGKAAVRIGVAAGVAAGAGLAVLAKKSIDAASAAQQSLGATETVFGRFAKTVEKTSKGAANAVGLSANEYRESANLIGSLFKNQGVAVDQLAGKTKTMIGTAADLAATFGGPTSDAVEALASAFKGEFDPLEKYGISIKQATITTAAWAHAGVDSAKAFGELTAQQQAQAKQLATTDLLMGQAAQTAGAFAKESNTLAGQQQRLGAQWENLKAKIGTALLPVVTRLFRTLNKQLMPALSQLANKWLPVLQKKINVAAKAFDRWARSFDAGKQLDKLKASLDGLKWEDSADGAEGLGTQLSKIGEALQGMSADTATDSLKVFSVVVGFAAEHVDLLAKALPFLLAGFAAYKSAQLLNNIAGRDSVVGLVAQIYQTRQLKAASDALATSLQRAAVANGQVASSTTTATSRLSKLGTAAKGAGGIAGLGLMAASSQTTSKELGILGGVAGGALTGFAVGGPWGAAIGAGAGLIAGLVKPSNQATDATKALGEQARITSGEMDGYKSSLDGTTGAVTALTRAEALKLIKDNDLLQVGKELGLSARDLVDASVGQTAGLIKVTQARAAEKQELDAARAAYGALGEQIARQDGIATEAQRTQQVANRKRMENAKENIRAIDELIGKTSKARAEARKDLIATADYGKALKRLPDRVQTRIEQKGLPQGLKGVAKLAKAYKLQPKEIRTVLRMMGWKDGPKNVKRVTDEIDKLKKTKPDLSRFARGVAIDTDAAAREAGKGGEKVAKAVKEKSSKARWNKIPFLGSLTSGLRSGKTKATTESRSIGEALKMGVLSGSFGMGDLLAAQMAADVRQGIAAARDAADARSPSKETEKLGKDLVAGLILGVQRGSDGVANVLEQLNGIVTNTLEQQLRAREKALTDRFAGMRRAITKSLKGKAEDKALAALKKRQDAALKALRQGWEKHSKAVRDALRPQIAALRELGRQQDDLASGNYQQWLKDQPHLLAKMKEAGVQNLEQARDRLQELTEAAADYAANIRDVFVAFGDITQLGRDEETGAVSFSAMMEQLRKRAEQATAFANLIKKFAGLGLSQTVIDQLIAAGPEAGLATAQAIDAGITQFGQQAIEDINAVTGTIATAGESLGVKLNAEFHDAGIRAAQGLVEGLESEGERLDKIARRMARQLIKAIKEELGIQSPSRVMMSVGSNVSRGLAIGVNDTHATNAGRSLASALIAGFGTPGLKASAADRPGLSGSFNVRLTGDQISDLERGRSIQLSLDAYRGAGGRQAAR